MCERGFLDPSVTCQTEVSQQHSSSCSSSSKNKDDDDDDSYLGRSRSVAANDAVVAVHKYVSSSLFLLLLLLFHVSICNTCLIRFANINDLGSKNKHRRCYWCCTTLLLHRLCLQSMTLLHVGYSGYTCSHCLPYLRIEGVMMD